ncbi:MAG: phosphodiester glycosidase family protein [Bacteroidales bacterium]|jgi:hypothetical protein|nr:phosphodiester glycosidase family protein [Bacteroidales bacterium]
MKKYFIIFLCSIAVICFAVGSCNDKEKDPCETNPQPGCPNYVDPCETTPQPGCPNYVDPCETNPQPGCPNYVDPETPSLAGSLTLGATACTVDSVSIEKVDDGLWYFYVQLKNAGLPLVIHTLRYTTDAAGYGVEAWSGHDSIMGKERPSAMVNRYEQAGREVKVAINGGFYGTAVDGTPVGMEVINGMTAFLPSPEGLWPVVGFDAQNLPYIDSVVVKAGVKDKDNRELAITSINGTRWADYLVLYNSHRGKRTGANEWGTEALCVPMTAQWEKQGNYLNVRCRIEKIESMNGKRSMAIPKGKIVLSGNGAAHTYLSALQEGDDVYVTVDYTLKSNPAVNSTVLRNAVNGLHIILRDGNELPIPSILGDGDKNMLAADNPRTSVGYSADRKYVYFTVVEGRRAGISEGVSTPELAQVMKYFGAANAINLDGGGSSCLMIGKETKNYCSDGSQRAVADGLAIIKK